MHDYLDDLEFINNLLLNDGVILSPTDTVWGLGCNAFSEKAVLKVFDIKQREYNKTCILLVDSINHLKKYIHSIHPRIETLIHYHERPLSIVYKANNNLPTHLVSDDGTVAIRVTKKPILKDLISLIQKPLISTSANESGHQTPSIFGEIKQPILSKVDYIFKSERHIKTKNPPSMLISYDDNNGDLVFLRK